MGDSTVIIVIALAASAVAGPLASNGPCARQCTESSKFLYNPGTSYFFDYESDAITTMQGATQEESRLHMKSRVEIHAISKCDFIMRLTGVSLQHSDPTNSRSKRPVEEAESFKQALERYTLRFSFQDGVVETVCAANGETAQVLNIKRGILSVLQTSASSLENTERVVETDVAGRCTVNYEPLGRGWNSVTVRKVKDLSACSERHNAETAIQSNPFLETKSMPLVRGSQDCQQVFKHNRLESVMCSETHVFRPFSRQEGGAVTKVTQALTFNSEKKTAFTGTEYSTLRKGMTFEHELNAEERNRRTQQVETTFSDLCQSSKDDIRPSVPGKFTTFVYGLRQLEFTDLVNMYRRVETICPENSKARKMFLDGVTMAGTSGAIKFVVEQMKRGEMSAKDVDLWISTLAFVNRPTKDTLSALLPLLDGKRMDAVLPVSAVVNTFCRQNAECGIKNEVRQVVEKIAGLLGNACNGDKRKVLLALKGLGNAGVAFEAEEKLQTCAQNKNLDIEVRVAAIQAYRRLSCDVMRSPILELYTDPDENVEVRIASFLNVMRCPSEAVFMKVKTTMETEAIKQVGSFVMSFLKNIEKQTPYKSYVRDIVNDVELLNKFESDVRKFSRNFQNSFFANSLDFGLAMDSNVIYDTKSYLPRTAMLNLTVDVMGTNLNLFELEGRAEGLEKIVERMFGPEGYFRKDKTKDSVRTKKSIADNKIEKYDRQFDVKSNFEKDASLSLDMKIFGNSLWYKKFQEGDMMSEAFSAMDIMVELAKEQEMELTKSFLFLDTTVHIPTGSGMPLKLTINGSAVMNLKMSGKVDAKSFQNVDVRGKIQPSGAVEIATMMSVDGIVAKTGLKMVATLHSSTILDGLVEIRSGKVYQARLNVPRDQIEIIDVQSRIFLVNGREEREQKSPAVDNSLYSQCTDFLTKKPLGIEMCGELQLPSATRKNAPLYPFSGPAKFRIFLRKTDPTLTHYNMEMKWTEDKSGREVVGQHMVMSFNTPQSTIDREISAEFHMNKQDSTLSMKLKVPNKKFSLTGKRIMNENEKRISVAVSIDDQEKFSVTTSMLTDAMEGGIRYQPTLEIRGPKSRLLNIRSSASVKNLKYSGDLIIEDLTVKPVVVKGEMTMGERNRYEVNAQVESYGLSSKTKGHIQFRNGFSSKMNVQYRIMEGRKESLDVTCKVRDLSTSGLIKYNGAASFASSAMPEISTTVSAETQFAPGHIESNFDLSFGDGRIWRVQKISVVEILKYQGSLENNNVEGTFRMTYPEKDIDFAFQMAHKNTLQSLNNDIKLKYAPGREVTSSVDLKFNPRPLNINGDILVKYPGREMKFQSSVNKKSESEYEGTMTAQWQRDKQIRAVGNFRDSSTREGRNYQATLEMTVPNSRPMSLASQVELFPGRYVVSADGDFMRGSYGIKGEYITSSKWNHRAMAYLKTPKVSYVAEGTLQKNADVITAKTDVNVPQYRRVIGTVEVSNGVKVKAGNIDIMWDADRDQSRRVQADVEYRMNVDGSHGKFNFKSPIKTLSGSYNGNYAGQLNSGIMKGSLHTELEWENKQKLTMDFGGNLALRQSRRQVLGEVKISAPGYDNMLMTVQHTSTLPEWNNKVVLQWKRNQKIIFGTEGKVRSDSISSFLDTSMKFSSPFRGFESFSLREVFEKNPSEISSSSMVQWDTGKTVELSLSGKLLGSSGVRAGANFTSPFNTLRDVSMAFSNEFSRNSIDTNIDLRWNIHNSVALSFDGRNFMTGRKHTCSAELQFTSTIPLYERMSTKVVYNKEPKSASLNSDFRWSNNKVTVDFSGTNRNSRYGYDMQGKMEYNSNFRNFEKGEIKLAHVNDQQKFSTNIESRLPYNHYMNMKVQGNMPSYKEVDSSLTLNSSFMDGISYEVAYKLDGNRLAANGVATYGSQTFTGDILGTTQFGYRAWDIDYKVNFKTPIRGLEDLKLSLTQTRRELQVTTRAQASKNQDTISFNHDVKVTDIKNFENSMRLETPFRSLRSVQLNTIQSGSSGEYKHNTDATWGGKKATLSMELNKESLRRGRNMMARINVQTPFQTLSRLDMEFSHEDDERNYKPRISIQWNDNNKVALDGVLKNNRFKKVDTSLSATTSFYGYETMMFTGKYDVTTRQKTVEMVYRWRSNKDITLRGALEADAKTGMVDIILTTPVRGLESAHLKTDYAIGENENALNVFAQYNEKSYIFNGKHVRSSNGNEVNIQISTPVYGYEKLAAFGSYAINRNDMTAETSYEWGNNKKVVTNAEYKYRTGKMITKYRLNTPFEGYRKMALKLESNVQNPRKTGSVLIEWDPNRTIEMNGAFESDFTRFGNVNLEFRSPFENVKEVSVNGIIKTISKEFAAEVTFQWMPQKKMTGNVLIKPTQILVAFDTPFRPYRNVNFVSKLEKQENGAGLTAVLEWDNSNKADVSTSYRMSENTFEGRVEANIPYNGKKAYSANVNIMNDNYKQMEGRVQINIPESRFETNSLIRLSKDNMEMTVSFEAPRAKVTVNGNFVNKKNEMEGGLKIDSNTQLVPNVQVKGTVRDNEITLNYEGDRTKVALNGNFINRNYRDMEGMLKIESNSQIIPNVQVKGSVRNHEITLNFEADRTRVKLNGNFVNRNNRDIEGMLKIDSNAQYIPSVNVRGIVRDNEITLNYQGDKTKLTLNGNFVNRNYGDMEGMLKIDSNTQYIPSFLLKGNLRNKEVTVLFEGPRSKVNFSGSFVNRNNRDIEGNMQMASNYRYLPTFSVKGSFRNQDWKNFKVSSDFNGVHLVSGSLKNDESIYQLEATVESPRLSSRRVSFSMNANAKDLHNMDCSLSVTTPSQSHTLIASEKYSRRGFEAELKLKSPSLRGEQMTAGVFYTSKKSKDVQLKISIVENRMSHNLEMRFINENRDVTGNLNIECSLLPSRTLNVEGKMSRPTDNTVDTAFTVRSGSVRHTFTANGKLLENQMEMTATLDTPALSPKPMSFKANLNNDNFRNIDGSVVFTNTAEESRVAFTMRRNGWRDLESFFTMNLPVQMLSMLRVDMKMKNDGFKSMEGSIDVQSSLETMRSLSLTGKMKNIETAWDMSFNFKLPVRNWDNISLLATVHKNPDMSLFSPRVTLSLPNKKYVVYAKYENTGNDIQAMIGSDWDNNKSEVTVEKHPNEYRAVVLTPIRGYETYSGVVNFRNERGRRTAQIKFEDARSRKYNGDFSLNFRNIVNFNGEANIKMPIEGLRDVSTKLRQQLRGGRWIMNFDHSMDRNKKLVMTIEHENNPVVGTIQIMTSMEEMKSARVNYNFQTSSNTNGKMELELNNQNIMRLAVDQTYHADTRAFSKSIQLELPTLPYTVSLSTKPLPNGSELNVKSVLPKRSVNFQTMYQLSATHFSHGTQLNLDELAGQTMSYEIRSSPTSRRGNEFFARLNMPLRSLELRTTHEKTSTGRTVSGDFFWDASRDQSRHMKLTLEHVDNSNRYNVAHKLRLTAAHPELSKDIILATECLLSRSEIYGKTEIEYSRYQQHNIFLEARASNSVQNRHETRYTASLIARHPVTNLDMKVTAEVANTQQEIAAEMQFNYLDRNLRTQIQELRTKIQKVKQEIELTARSNENKVNLLGRMFHRDNELTLALEQTINNESPLHSHFRWSQRHRNMELNVSSPNGDRIHVRASMPDDHFEAELGHTVSGRRYKDGNFYLGLKDRKILETRVNWRPEIFDELKEGMTVANDIHMPRMRTVFDGVQDEISNEIESKTSMLSRAIAQETKPFVTEIAKEMKKLQIDSQRASNEIYQMYRRNEFYMRTASNSLDGLVEAASWSYYATFNYVAKKYEVFAETLSMSIDIMTNIFDGMVEDMSRLTKYYQRAAQRTFAKWSRNISQLKKEYIDGLAEIIKNVALELVDRLGRVTSASWTWTKDAVRYYAPTLERYWETAVKNMRRAASWLREHYGQQMRSVTEHPGFIALSEYLSRVMETITEFEAQATYDQMIRSSRIFLNNGAENLAAAYNYIIDHPNINYLNDLASNTFDRSRRIVAEFGMNTVAVNVLEELFQKVQSLTWNAVRDLAEDYTNFRGNARVTYEPENGKVEVEMQLPVVRNNLKQLFDINSYPQVQKLRELTSQMSFGDFCIWDTYYKYKRYLDVNYWLPPFKAQAMIVGSQHYITFDSLDFEFAGECSYLLARDFVDGNFTVTVNYIRDDSRVVKKSLNIYSDGVKIEVSRDSKVTVDDRKVELPQEIGQTTLTTDDGVITISNRKGYQIRCNFVHDLCTMEVSGFYFGKTGGLFGTNNYERELDMMTPEMKIADSLEQFSSSWQVGTAQCTKKKNMAEIAPVNQRAQEKCEDLFKNLNSEFRSGFKQVDPEPFLRMCIKDLSPIREAEHKLKICSTAAAYVERCRQEGVNLNMPKQCVRCERMNADHLEGGDVVKITKDEPVRAVDVVFIVEEKDCNKNSPAVLSKLAQSLDDGFRKLGHRQVHFAVVGFGGDGIYNEPHVVTSDSKVFGTVRNVDSALNSLTTGNGDSNIFMALRYAAGLNFMTGSTKTFVLSKCSACKSEEIKADYSEMLRTMLDGDITLHLIMDHEFQTRPPNKPEQAKKVLGFDRKHAYTTKDMKSTELRGDRDLLAQLKLPKDLCVPLAIEVNGSFFSMARLQDKRSANKKTIEVMSKRVLKTAEPADCQICECIETESGVGKSVCQRCVSPVVAQLVGDDASPMINYGSYEVDNDVE